MDGGLEERVEVSNGVQNIDDGFEERVEVIGRLAEVYTPCVPKEYIPHIGMEFESEEIAYSFYNNYGRLGGFNIRKDYFTKSRKDNVVINRKIVCAKEGQRKVHKEVKVYRRGIRTNCLAFIYISLNREVGKWVVTRFEEGHNHHLHLLEVAHMIPSQQKLVTAPGLNDVSAMELSDKYILGQWRRDAKDCSSRGSIVSVDEEDPKLAASTRYRNLCPKVLHLVSRASRHKGAYERVSKTVDELCKEVDLLIDGNTIEGEIVGEDVVDPNLARIEALKREDGGDKCGRRLKPWQEKNGKKKKGVSQPSNTSQDMDDGLEERVEVRNGVQNINDGFEERVEVTDGLAEVYTPCVPKEYMPHIGMEFESEEIAYNFYNNYGRLGGFNIRKDYLTKSRKDNVVINRKIVCAKEGQGKVHKKEVKEHRRGTRTNCLAFIYISLNREVGKWVVTKFEEGHNHPLHVPEVAHTMPSKRKLLTTQACNVVLAMELPDKNIVG